MEKFVFSGENPGEAEAFVSSLGEKPYRSGQIYDWIFKKGVFEFPAMSNLPGTFIPILKEKSVVLTLKQVEKRVSKKDGTRKYLFKLEDGNLIESVLLPAAERVTVCVSTQAGCPLGCVFCATGLHGFMRNLKADEIVAQYLLMNRDFIRDTGRKVTNIVVMGMGEPFLNFRAVEKALKIFSSCWGAGISERKITVSTSGIITGIQRFSNLNAKYKLSISLHSPYDDKRKQLIPVNKKYSLKKVLYAVERYIENTGMIVTFQYLMIRGINDTGNDALELARILKNIKCNVNLIIYNRIKGLPFRRPLETSIDKFINILESKGIFVKRRRSMGEEIDSGCGQLRSRKMCVKSQ